MITDKNYRLTDKNYRNIRILLLLHACCPSLDGRVEGDKIDHYYHDWTDYKMWQGSLPHNKHWNQFRKRQYDVSFPKYALCYYRIVCTAFWVAKKKLDAKNVKKLLKIRFFSISTNHEKLASWIVRIRTNLIEGVRSIISAKEIHVQ